MTEQDFKDYKSKYLDLYDKVKSSSGKEKVSILEDVDFELELIHRDEINVYYILRLLANYKGAGKEEKERIKKTIANLLANEIELRSKRELIEEFINEDLPLIGNAEDILSEFEEFWSIKQNEAFEKLCRDEKIPPEKAARLSSSVFLIRKRCSLIPSLNYSKQNRNCWSVNRLSNALRVKSWILSRLLLTEWRNFSIDFQAFSNRQRNHQKCPRCFLNCAAL